MVDLSNSSHRPAVPLWMTKDPRWQALDKQISSLEEKDAAIGRDLERLQGQLDHGNGDKGKLQVDIAAKKQERCVNNSQMAKTHGEMVDLSIDLRKLGP